MVDISVEDINKIQFLIFKQLTPQLFISLFCYFCYVQYIIYFKNINLKNNNKTIRTL